MNHGMLSRVLRTAIIALMPAAAMISLAAGFAFWSQPVHAFFGRRDPSDAVDFVVFYAAAKQVVSGHAYQLYDLSAALPLQRAAHPGVPASALPIPYFNPPFFALLVSPLGWLSFGRAYQVWSAIKLLLLALDCWMVWRISGSLATRYRVLVLLFFATLEPVAFSLALGQFSLILVSSWTGAYLLFRDGHDRAAGLALAPLLIKPELLLPIAVLLAWKRRTSALAALAGVTMIAIAVSIALVGVHGLYAYPKFVLTLSAHPGNGVERRLMFGWNGLIASIMHRQHMALQSRIVAALTVPTLAALAYGWRGGWRRDEASFTRQWMLLTLVTVLVDAHFYIQDISLVMPVAIALACDQRSISRTVAAAALALGWAILALGLIPMREWRFNPFSLCMALGVVALVCADLAARRAETIERSEDETRSPDLRGKRAA